MRRLISGVAAGGAALLTLATQVAAQSRFDSDYYEYDPLFDAAAGSAFSGAAGLFALSMYCCIFLLMLVVPVGLAIFVYKDAQKNRIENPILWALLTFFLNVIGLLVYFLAIKPDALKAQESRSSSFSSSPPREERESVSREREEVNNQDEADNSREDE